MPNTNNIVLFNQAPLRELIEKHAFELAKELGEGNETTKSQLRRFYQEYNDIRNKIRYGDENAYEKNEVALKMLIAKAQYAGGRQGSKLPKMFIDWLVKNIKAIKSKEDVEVFGNYFEAFLGYFYGVRGERDRGANRR